MIKKINAKIKQMDKLKQNINALILNLPDNPKFTHMSGSDRIGTINISDTDGIFSVFYHNFRAQYKKIIEIINESKPENIIKNIEKITIPNKHGAHWYRKGNESYRFHPDAIKNIKGVLYGS
jgi:hypothetical protein